MVVVTLLERRRIHAVLFSVIDLGSTAFIGHNKHAQSASNASVEETR